ncbi:MAG: nucleotidyltransferase [Bacteroidales bacterium]|nr:nucleotidyltransferase [Bacteroidales bacterium]
MNLITRHIHQILTLCKTHRVRTLSVFGSILTNRFTDKSDVDFLVDFEPAAPDKWDYVDNYFSFRDALSLLLGREIDLIEEKGITNPLFRKAVDQSKRKIYG